MHLVDTSAWIHALRPSGSAKIRELLRPLIENGDAVITEWILLELMTGLASKESQDAMMHRFAPVTRLPWTPELWPESWSLAAHLRKNGVTPTAADCLIATVAIAHRVPLIHCDGDFEDIRSHSRLQTVDWTAHVRPHR